MKGTAMTTEEFMELTKKAQERFDALPAKEKLAHREAQRRSWVIGALMLENPSMTKEEANKIYDKAKDRQ
jgi:hypothetical protein